MEVPGMNERTWAWGAPTRFGLGKARLVAQVIATLALYAVLVAGSDCAVVAARTNSENTAVAAHICETVIVRVRATHWVWVREVRRIHGHRVVVRRHGKIVYVRLHASYLKAKPQKVCTATTLAPMAPASPVPPSSPVVVVALAPSNTAPPSVSGVAQVGQTLTASTGKWTEDPTAYEYQWQRCEATGANCSPISTATMQTYTVTRADPNSTLRVSVTASNADGSSRPAISAQTAVVPEAIKHLEYVFDDGLISVYDMDNEYRLVKTISLPQTDSGIRGVSVAPAQHLLLISYGGDGGSFGGGSVLAYNLIEERVVWTVNISAGIDSGAVSPDGTKLYEPTGENNSSGVWNILSTANGAVLGTIQGGSGAHNTVVSNNGRYVYLGNRDTDDLGVYDTTTGEVHNVGPLKSTVRPFTVNGSNTLAFTTATEFDGFQVSSITSGKVLFTTSFGSTPSGFPFSAPSHGIGLSPNEKELYVIDSVNKEVRFYSVSEVLGGVAPTLLGVVPVAGLTGEEEDCAYDCTRGGWIQLSIDGRLLFVGDSGAVIETATRKVVTTIPTLLNTKKSLEVEWAGGVPVASSERTGVGQVG
jgi:hypothetical protein